MKLAGRKITDGIEIVALLFDGGEGTELYEGGGAAAYHAADAFKADGSI